MSYTPPRASSSSWGRYSDIDSHRSRSPPRRYRRSPSRSPTRDWDRRRRSPSPSGRSPPLKRSRYDYNSPPRSSRSLPEFGALPAYSLWLSWQDPHIPPNILQKTYDDLKASYDHTYVKPYWNTLMQRASGWCKDTYHPSSLRELESDHEQYAKDAVSRFFEDLVELKQEEWPSFSVENPRLTLLTATPLPPVSDLDPLVDEEKELEEVKAEKLEDAPEIETVETDAADIDITPDSVPAPSLPGTKKRRRNIASYLEPLASPCTLFIPQLPAYISRKELQNYLSQVDSGTMDELLLTDPSPLNRYLRHGWVTYSTPEAAKEAVSLFNMKVLPFGPGVDELKLKPHTPHFENPRPLFIPNISSTSTRIHADLENVQKLTRAFDRRYGIADNILLDSLGTPTPEHINEEAWRNLGTRLDAATEVEKLDLMIAYLQRVFGYVYYLAFRAIPQHRSMLQRLQVVRGPHSTVKEWSADLDDKSLNMVEVLLDENWPCGDRRVERAVDDFCLRHVEKEREERYRCRVVNCDKRFKGEKFVIMHIQNKHQNELDSIREGVYDNQAFLNYISDKLRLVPSSEYSLSTHSSRFAPSPMIMPVPMPVPTHVHVPQPSRYMPMSPYTQQYPPQRPAVIYADIDNPSQQTKSAFEIDFDSALAAFSET